MAFATSPVYILDRDYACSRLEHLGRVPGAPVPVVLGPLETLERAPSPDHP